MDIYLLMSKKNFFRIKYLLTILILFIASLDVNASERNSANPYPVPRPNYNAKFFPYPLNQQVAVYGHSLIGDLVLKGLTSDLVVGGRLRVERPSVFHSSISAKTANFDSLTVGGKSIFGGPVNLIGAIDNEDIANNAAIAYSKINLVNSIANGDISSSAAIVYSKLNLTGSITNNDISPSAAISYSKLNLANRIANTDILPSAAIAYSKLNLASSIINADISPGASIAYSKLNLTDSVVAGDISDGAVTSAKLSAAARTHSLSVFLPDPGGAGASISNYITFKAPVALTLTKLQLIPAGNYVGSASASGTAVARKNNESQAIVSFSTTTNLTRGTINNMGALNAAEKVFAPGDNLTIDLDGSKNLPEQSLQIDYVSD